MKVLLLNQFFWPDSSATSQLLTDLARSLAESGDEVTAISSSAGGYAVTETPGTLPGISSVRVPALPFGRGRIGRILAYLSFYITATWRGLILPKQDVVLTLTTPPLLSLVGTVLKLLRGSRHVIWEMDMYPDVATDLGYFRRGGLADRVVGLLADFSRRHADQIIALGECMRSRLLARGVHPESITVVHNWADSQAISALPRTPSEELILLYSGNLGLAHDLSTIIPAMTALREDPRFKFLFVGSGGRRADLAAAVALHGLRHVELKPYVERATLSDSLAAGDIGLVTQQAECCGSVVPSKVYGLLAAGRPILFIGPAAATPALLVKEFNCGWHVEVGESERLVQLLLHLAGHRDEIAESGSRARQALLNHFDRPLGVARIQAVLRPVPSTTETISAVEANTTAADPLRNHPPSPSAAAYAQPLLPADPSATRGDHQTCTL